MTIEYTIRFASDAAIERTLGCVLTTTELATVSRLVGGYYFRSERSPVGMLYAFAEEGIEVEDFDSFTFESK